MVIYVMNVKKWGEIQMSESTDKIHAATCIRTALIDLKNAENFLEKSDKNKQVIVKSVISILESVTNELFNVQRLKIKVESRSKYVKW